MAKKFIAILKEKQKGALTKDLLNSHVQYLKKMKDEGKLFICGPFKDNDRALQILISEDIQSAKKLIESDPFIKKSITIAIIFMSLLKLTKIMTG